MLNSKNNSKEKYYNFFLPISFILTIIPLIVRLTAVKTDEYTLGIFGQTTMTDLFSQKKAFFLLIFCIILIGISAIFFKKIFQKKDKIINSILISVVVFLLFTFLSTIFSQYKQVSLWGFYDRAEGFVTITCYLVLLVYSIYTFKSTNNYKYITIPILILVCINSFLGLFQYLGQDLIQSNLGRSIVLPSEYLSSNNKLDLLYEAGKLYGTLFHYNYVGSFVAIVLPILFCLTIFEYEDIMYKIFLGIGTLLSLWLLVGSTSRAGIIGISISTILGIIIFWKLIIQKRKPILIFLVSILVISTGLNFATKGSLFERVPSLISDTFSVFKDTSDFDYKENTPVKDITYTDSTTEIVLPNETLKITYENGAPVLRSSKDKVIPYTLKDKVYSTNVEPFNSITFAFGKLDKKSVIADTVLLNFNSRPTFLFKLNDDKIFHLADMSTHKYIDLQYPDTFGFNGKEKLGSSRGYIWSRSIPLIKDTILLGNGPDTFIFEFPQNDLIGKYYAYDTPNSIVDKPHNLYLQIALNYGVIALLGFLAIMIIYIVDSIKLYSFKDYYDNHQISGAATCLGVIGYLFAGMFNDSVISVAPVFWIVLGVGIAINFKNRDTIRTGKMK